MFTTRNRASWTNATGQSFLRLSKFLEGRRSIHFQPSLGWNFNELIIKMTANDTEWRGGRSRGPAVTVLSVGVESVCILG